MKKKGFTLMEMLVVLALIAIILIIAIPSVIKLRNTQAAKEYDVHQKIVKQALDTYTVKYQSQLKAYEQTASCMKIDYTKKLVNTEILNEKGINCDGTVVLIPKNNNTYDYKYFLNCTNENGVEFSHYNPSDLAPYSTCQAMDENESNDATLKSLEVEGYTISPVFNSATKDYTLEVDSTVVNVKVKAEATDTKAMVKIIGGTELKAGANEITVKVVAEDGTPNKYTITVTKEKNSIALLSSLTTDVCTLEEDENGVYTCRVGNDVVEANITAVPQATGTTITGTGVKELVVGDNPIEIVVTAEDGTEKKYQINIVRDANADTRLATLRTDVCEILFEKDTREYECTVGNEITAMEVEATPYKTTSTVIGAGTRALEVGTHAVEVTVKAENGAEGKYTINVTREANTNAYLRSLTISNCELTPVFNKKEEVYACSQELESTIGSVEVSAEPEKSTSSVVGTGTKEIDVGTNAIKVIVTSEDGTPKTYTITVTRKASNNAYLKSLAVEGYTLEPGFNKETTVYDVVVENNTTELGIIYEKDQKGATVEVEGNENLPVGDKTVKVRVTAEDGITKIEYTLRVHRKSNDATLRSLGIEGNTITPSYNAATEGYRAVVENEVTGVNVVYTKNHPSQQVTIEGNENLPVGDRNVVVKVEAEDGTKKTYTIVVHRKSNDTTLRSLSVRGQILTPGYNAETLEYGITVENNVESIEVNYEKNHNLQEVTIVGNTGLRVGDNTVTVKVVAEDESERTYTINVHRKSNDATLKSLGIRDHNLNKAYNSAEENYEVILGISEVNVVVEYEKNYPLQTVEVEGNVNAIEVGDNEIKVKVTAEDGTKKTYKINVHKKSDDATLKSLGIIGYELDNEFNKNTLEYKVEVEYSKTSVEIEYETTNEHARVEKDASNNLAVGDNYIQLRVTAESGREQTYTVNVYRKNNDARLKSIVIPGCDLYPAFNKDTKRYVCEVRYNVTDVIISAETNDTKGRIISGVGTYTVDWGTREYKIKVGAEDANTAYDTEYVVSITKNKDSRARLANLEVVGYTIKNYNGGEFEPNGYEYYVNTESTSLEIKAEAESEVATIVGTGTINIGWETKVVTVVVTAQNGAIETYKITITNSKPTTPELKSTPSDWTTGNVVVEVSKDGYAESELDRYEYYKTLGTGVPTSATTPTGTTGIEEADSSLTVTEEGLWKVYYRMLSTNGNRSEWSTGVEAKIDRTAPTAPTGVVTSGTEGLNGWYTSNVEFTVTNGTDALSGYNRTTYTLEGATTKEETSIANNGKITISNEGITTITLYGYDNVGNRSDGVPYIIKVDKTNPPAGTIAITSGTKKVSTSEWYTSDVVVKFTQGTDATSGVNRITYKLDKDAIKGGQEHVEETIANNGTITINTDGITTVTMYTYDNAGRKSEKTLVIKRDTTNPTYSSLTITSGTKKVSTSEWYTSDVKVKINKGTDATSEFDRVTYKLTADATKGGQTKTETTIADGGEVTINTDGITTVTAYTYDKAGNRSEKTLVVKRDTTNPETLPTASVTSGTAGTNGWYTSNNVVLTVTDGNDLTSGYKETKFKVTGATTLSEDNLNSAKTITITNEGENVVTLYGYDQAGNRSENSYTIKIDKTNPPVGTIAVKSGTEGLNGWYTSNVVVKFTQGTDTPSGVNRITYKLTPDVTVGGQTQAETTIANNGEVTINTDGITTVTMYTYDNAGRKSEKTLVIKRDTTTPTESTLTITSGTEGLNSWYTSDVKVKINKGTDATSGYDKLTYKLTGDQTKTETEITDGGEVTINTDGTTTVTAYTYDKAGNKKEKTLVVKRDTTPPTCTLKVTTSGVSFDTKTDAQSLASYGMNKTGTAEYNSTSTLGLDMGKYYGYVKDAAGNESRCTAQLSSTYIADYTKTEYKCQPYSYNYCSSGDSLSGSTCTTTTPYNAYWSEGYYYCSSGDSLSGSKCTKTTTSYTNATWHDGYYYCNSGSLSGSTCTITSSYPATASYSCCPFDIGFGGCRPGRCGDMEIGRYRTSTSYSCPNGGELSDQTCITTTTTDASYRNGWYTCSSGSLTGTQCEITSTSTYNAYYSSGYYYCNWGDSRSGSTCYRTSTYNAYSGVGYDNFYDNTSYPTSCTNTSLSCSSYTNGQTYHTCAPRTYSCKFGTKLNDTYCYTVSEPSDVDQGKYKIKFVKDDGTAYSNLWTNTSGGFTFPGAPAITGQAFQGWVLEPSLLSGSAANTAGTESGPFTYYPVYSLATYTVTVENGEFEDGTTSKVLHYGDTVTAHASGLPATTWTGFVENGDTRRDEQRTFKWVGDTTKTITVTDNTAIRFDYDYDVTGEAFQYKVKFKDSLNTDTEYSSVWTDVLGNGTFTYASAPTKSGYEFVGWGDNDEHQSFKDMILADNKTIKTNPTLTTSSANSGESGLYKMSVTNGFGGADGDTYYFRGNVSNNIVEFAGLTWRIVRINEDGTIRLILDDSMNTTNYNYSSSTYGNYSSVYYSNSNAKNKVEEWYTNNITGNNAAKVIGGDYFCQAAVVATGGDWTPGSASVTAYSNYTPNLKCIKDGNNMQYYSSNVGMLTYDEFVLAGGYYQQSNTSYYLYNKANGGTNNINWWLMSSAGVAKTYNASCAYAVCTANGYNLIERFVSDSYRLRPVINLKADVVVTKNAAGHYVVSDANATSEPGSSGTVSGPKTYYAIWKALTYTAAEQL